jgi:cytoskeleton protein RodZ
MTDHIATPGPRLKAERERRGLSSQKAADELHLDGWIIDALEAEDYQRIGPSVYAKGHLKRYADLLGLPPAEIIAGYDSRAQAPRAPAPQPVTVRVRTDEPAASGLPWPQITGCAIAVLLAVGLFWWKPWHRHAAPTAAPAAAMPSGASAGSATDADTGTTAGSGSPAAPPAATTPASTAPSATLLGAAASAAAEPDATAGAGHARLRLSFSADSWVDVHDAAGRRVFAGNGRANSVKTVAGIAPMRVYLGFASGVQLEINDRTVAIGPQFVAGDVARFEAGADGVLRRDSQSRSARPTG